MEAIVPKGAEARGQRRQPRDIYRKKDRRRLEVLPLHFQRRGQRLTGQRPHFAVQRLPDVTNG